MLPSDSGSSTRDVSLSTASSPNGSARINTPRSDASPSICGDQAASVRGHSAEQDATNDLDDLFDINSGTDSDLMNELAFDLSDPDDEDPLTLQEMYEDLEDILGPGNEEELWNIRMFQLFISRSPFKLYLRRKQYSYRGRSGQCTSIQAEDDEQHAAAHVRPDAIHLPPQDVNKL